jgi:threonine/homoserine/homoserine lactone efflux protein
MLGPQTVQLHHAQTGTVLTAIVPGANTYRTQEGVYRFGLKGGISATAGVMAADVVFIVVAAVGLGALVQTYPILFIDLLLAGTVFFSRLGWRILTNQIFVRALHDPSTGKPGIIPTSSGKIARNAFLICIAKFKAIFLRIVFARS